MNESVRELAEWTESLEAAARDFGLGPFPVVVDLLSSRGMAEAIALAGFPSRYAHWTFAKTEHIARIRYGVKGFDGVGPVANTNPTIIAIPEADALESRLLKLARGIAMSDFYRCNVRFRNTKPEYAATVMAQHRKRLSRLVSDSKIAPDALRVVLDSAHAIRFVRPVPSSLQRPSLLRFIARHAEELEDAERIALEVVDEETEYFAPQLETEMLREGWAAYWQIRLLDAVTEQGSRLSDALHLEYARTALRYPRLEQGEWLQLRLLGVRFFEEIVLQWDRMVLEPSARTSLWDGRSGLEKIFLIREAERDHSALMQYLTEDMARRAGLFRFEADASQTHGKPTTFVVRDLPDREGFPEVRDALFRRLGFGALPTFEIIGVDPATRTLCLRHRFDGRELDTSETIATMHHVENLWRERVLLETKAKNGLAYWYAAISGGIVHGDTNNMKRYLVY